MIRTFRRSVARGGEEGLRRFRYDPRTHMPRLHVNVDHVATLRQARREAFPDPVEWALAAERAGAEGITAHLRTDRRHIQDDDVVRLKKRLRTRLNFEMSLDPGIVAIALRTRPHAVCIVPENRAEVTTEGGLDVVREARRLCAAIPRLARAGAEVSLFVDPDVRQIEAACEVGAEFVELHTGSYARAQGRARARELARLAAAALHARAIGLRVNAGHGLDYQNVGAVAALSHVEELNIGFAIVARSVFDGVDAAVSEMARLVRGRARAARASGSARRPARTRRTA
jgi:pyridoxine 5-phosphate synthase